MESRNVLQRIKSPGLDETNERYGLYYRFVDPWQVAPHIEGAVSVLAEGQVGRMRVEPIRAGETADIAEVEKLGPHVRSLWCTLRGDIWVKETIALAVPPLVREAGVACSRVDSSVDAFHHMGETEAYTRAITRHLYRNALFARLRMPFRFMTLIQVNLTDLQPVHQPGQGHSHQGSRHLDLYSIVRLKRRSIYSSNKSTLHPPLTAKSRTADTVMTDNVRAFLHPSPPPSAHGGSSSLPSSASSSPSHHQQQLHQQDEASLTTALHATFRFALPEECLPARGLEAVEWLAKGPPRIIHILLYEKRTIMADSLLGEVEVPLSSLTEEEFIDAWLPVRTRDHHHHHHYHVPPSSHFQPAAGGGWTAGARSVTPPPTLMQVQQGQGGREGGGQTVWMVRVQVLLSFLLMSAKHSEEEMEGGRRTEEDQEEKDGEGEEEEEGKEGEHEVRATSMMDDL
ncbi:hypothetical protein VYU27_007254 [Nannochloropsis oceanica]